MFPGPYVTGSINYSPPNTTTSWYYNTAPVALTTHNATVNKTAASLIAAATAYCPITNNDTVNGWTIYDLPQACWNLTEPWCEATIGIPPPTSTRFPAVCSPAHYYSTSTTTTAASSGAAPSPTEPGTISSCKSYYQVESGDTCYSIETNFGITATQVNITSLCVTP